MATFEAKPNTGSLWAVQDRPADTYPNLRGDINLDRDFIINLQNVLPCKYCRQNLKTNMSLGR